MATFQVAFDKVTYLSVSHVLGHLGATSKTWTYLQFQDGCPMKIDKELMGTDNKSWLWFIMPIQTVKQL